MATTCKSRGFDGQVTVAAAEIGDVTLRQQVSQRSRPRRPAPAGHELPAVSVRRKALLAKPQNFLQPRLVGARGLVGTGRGERRFEHLPDGGVAVARLGRRHLVVREPALAALLDQAAFPEQAQVP